MLYLYITLILTIMNALYKFLFPSEESTKTVSVAILALRLVFGLFIISHGYMKLTSFSTLEQNFPDPLGVGSQLSLMLAIFAELFCGLAFTFGFITRVVLIPLIFTMLVAVFVIHANDPMAVKELAILYLAVFCISYISGPGRYSVDYVVRTKLIKK